MDFDVDPSEANKMKLCVPQKKLEGSLIIEESYCKQKANIRWLVEGDKNTKFFHRTVQNRKQKLNIFRLKNKVGNWITDGSDITQKAIHSLQSQLNGIHCIDSEFLFDNIPNIISHDQNESLSQFPTLEETHNVITSMSYDSAWDLMDLMVSFINCVGTLLNRIFIWPYVTFLPGENFQKLGHVLINSQFQRLKTQLAWPHVIPYF